MRKQLLIAQILIALCGSSLFALGCKDPVVKNEMEKASEEMKKAGHEAAEAARAGGRAAEAGREAAADIKQETEKAKAALQGAVPATKPDTTPETPPDQK
jgi:hypothetical protein